MLKKELVITIDGPSGAGKTTVSKMLAARIGYRYIDTGALYRGIALETQRQGISADDEDAIALACKSIDLRFRIEGDDLRLFSGDRDISDMIRSSQISMRASKVSALGAVRSFLTVLQRRLGEERAVVFEGRDMGTVIFPEADVKFFLDADTDIRAERRYLELKARGDDIDFDRVRRDIVVRDTNDSNRKLAPLKPAEDAVHVDASHMGIEDVVDKMVAVVTSIRP